MTPQLIPLLEALRCVDVDECYRRYDEVVSTPSPGTEVGFLDTFFHWSMELVVMAKEFGLPPGIDIDMDSNITVTQETLRKILGWDQ